MLTAGSQAPDFSLGDWSLSGSLRNGPVLLVFFKISCPTCQLALPYLQRLNDGAGPGALRIVPISQDNRDGAAQFQRHFGISMPVEIDAAPAYAASNLYRIHHVPSLFLIEPDGSISMSVHGFSREHLEQLGSRFGARVFQPDENLPAFRPG
ncbi:MAG: TlpA family protein disulfide reductase [Acidobacteriota bacterium]|nr:TlpA family protein disulfide reductase [Acidobacteriota bacterium]